MSSYGTYDVNKLIVTYGVLHLTGWSDTSYLNISYNNDWWVNKSGANGEVASVKSNRLDGNVIFTLLQTANDNDILSGFLLTDFASNAPLPLLIKDLRGSTMFECAQSRIIKPADTGFSVDPQDRAWTVFCPRLIPFIGGNDA